MYAFRLKLGPGTYTASEVIYHDIKFINGISTTICSEREREFFRASGMAMETVEVKSPEFDSLRAQLADEQKRHNAALAAQQGFYAKQINDLDAACVGLAAENKELRKQISVNLELIELRAEIKGLKEAGKIVKKVLSSNSTGENVKAYTNTSR